MQFDCYEQLLAPRGAAVCEIAHSPPPGTDIDSVGPIRGTIKLTNVGSHIRAVGTLRASVRLLCSRCLAPAEQQLEAEIDEECSLTQIDEPDSYEVDTDDVDAMPILDAERVDLSELVRQTLIINLPTAVVCRPDCAGLCPQCGANLNDGPCGCPTERIDPRLAKLRELLDRDSSPGAATGGAER